MEYLPQVLEDMKVRGVEPNLVTYSTMLKGYAQACDMPNAMRMLEKVQQDPHMQPDEIMFKYIEDLSKEYRLEPNGFVYANLIQACVWNRQLNMALAVLQQMVDRGLSPLN